MNNFQLQNYGVETLSNNELEETNGGCIGCLFWLAFGVGCGFIAIGAFEGIRARRMQ